MKDECVDRIVLSANVTFKKNIATQVKTQQKTNKQKNLDYNVSPPAGSASLQRSETLLWASGADLCLVDNDRLGLNAVFGPVSQVVQRDLFGVYSKHILKDEKQILGVRKLETERSDTVGFESITINISLCFH